MRFQEIVSVNVVTIYSSVPGAQSFHFMLLRWQGAKERMESWTWRGGWEGTGRETVGAGAGGLRWGGGWMQKAEEGGASRVEDKEVSDCIYLKISFWGSPHWPDIWFSWASPGNGSQIALFQRL